jgi:uncharacterized membrane protein HdeD (DUF308 family)
MTNTEMEVTSTGRDLIFLGVVTIVLGAAAIAAPMIAGISIVLSVGLLVMVGGILRMVGAFEAGSFGKRMLVLALGVLMVLCGLALVTEPLFAFGFLTVFIAAYLFADGIAEVVGALRLRAKAGRAWLLFGGVVSILLGTMIWRQFPLSGAWAIGVVLGIKLLLVGAIMIAGGSAARALATTRMAEA